MNLYKLAHQFYVVSQSTRDPKAELKLLNKINNSPMGYVATSDLTDEEWNIASRLQRWGELDLVPENHGVTQDVERNRLGDPTRLRERTHVPSKRKFPERFVITQSGAETLESFKYDTLHQEDVSSYSKLKTAPPNDDYEYDVRVNKTLDFTRKASDEGPASFKDKDRVGQLEDVVGKLKNIKLEDYK
jgi:hypothetical protein